MPRRHPARTAALVAPLLVFGLAAFGVVGPEVDSARLLGTVLGLVSNRFVDSLPAESLYVRAARGLVAEVKDPYAALYSPQDLAYFKRQTIGDVYGGVGMEVTNDSGGVRVTRVFSGAPSARMGVQVGDHVIDVDGTDTRGMTIDQVSARLMGAAGSEVRITVERYGVASPIRMSGRRAVVNVPAVPTPTLLDGGVGYVPLQHFSGSAAREVADAIRRLRAQGATRFVLDLRANGGGDLNAAVAVSELFLAPGAQVVTVRSRATPNERHEADDALAPADTLTPLVVMVDDGTASASEIVAGALQDHDRALVVGTTSYGKGLVQTLFPLDGGWALKMTTGRWYTPSGRLIQRERKLDASGRLVEVAPDSLETDAARRGRPTFRSDRGRIVYGGGGITPDVIVPADSLTTSEQAFVRALAPAWSVVSGTVERYALELRARGAGADERATVRRDSLYERLQRAGARVSRPVFDGGARLVDRWIERRVVSLVAGDSAWVRRSASVDPQLARAVALLRGAPTTNALIASAARAH